MALKWCFEQDFAFWGMILLKTQQDLFHKGIVCIVIFKFSTVALCYDFSVQMHSVQMHQSISLHICYT